MDTNHLTEKLFIGIMKLVHHLNVIVAMPRIMYWVLVKRTVRTYEIY